MPRRDESLSVGDWVLAAVDAHGQSWVHERVPPVSHLARRDAQGRARPLVSNVDTALLVMGLDDDFNPRRTERYLALVQGSGVMPVVVLTKADLLPDAQRDERIDTLRERVPANVEVLAVDATAAPTAQRLAPWLAAGQTLVLLGSSGAGKSTLTNTLLGAAVQSTGAVREHDSRGKHTTTSRSLFRLPQGACVIDTPGVRTLRPDIDEASLAASFDDIATLASPLPLPGLRARRRARLRGARRGRRRPAAQLPQAGAGGPARHDVGARAPAPGRRVEGAQQGGARLHEGEGEAGMTTVRRRAGTP